MTDKFDPKATPDCDKDARTAGEFSDDTVVLHISDAKDLEVRARVAERKLEIVMGNFEAYLKKHKSLDVEVLLNHIEREFELNGLPPLIDEILR